MPLSAVEFPNVQMNLNAWPTSPATRKYNCIAWAAGDDTRWWEPDSMGLFYWPPAVLRSMTLHAYILAFESLGYTRGATPALQPGVEKVALFVKNISPTHAARQLANGPWTSKMGRNIDITHQTLGVIEGPMYGHVREIMSRPRTA